MNQPCSQIRNPNSVIRNSARRALPLALRSLLLFALCSLPFAFAAAQTNSATLSGTVADEKGAVIPGAQVTVTNSATGLKREATTNTEGSFSFPLLQPATYSVRAQQTNFAPLEISNVVLNVGDRKALQIQLKAGDINATVQVINEAPLINESPAVGTVIDRRFVENLPLNGRSFNTLLQLTPGVVIAPSALSRTPGQFNINGQRANANMFEVDGVSANFGVNPDFGPGSVSQAGSGATQAFNAYGGTSGLVSVDAMQEFRIETSSFAPEFGRTPGGQVLISTRSGTNQFHGDVFDYLRNDKLDANNWFANAAAKPRAAERQNDFGGVLGGPIIRDKAFFFFSYEGLRLLQPQAKVFNVPTLVLRASALPSVQPILNAYPKPDNTNATGTVSTFTGVYSNRITPNADSIRLDHTLNNSRSIFGRYNHAPSQSVSRINNLANLQTAKGDIATLTIGGNVLLTSHLSGSFRFNYSRDSAGSIFQMDSFGGATPPPSTALIPSPFNAESSTAIFQATDSSSFQMGNGGTNKTSQWNVIGDAVYVVRSHELKFGIDYRRIVLTQPGLGFSPNYIVTNSATYASTGNALLALVSSFRPASILFPAFSTYAQDRWNIGKRLTLTYGLRWEVNPAPSPRNGAILGSWLNVNDPTSTTFAPIGTPPWKTTYDNFAPRVGIAFRVNRKGDLVVRAGWGLFYDLGTGISAVLGSVFPNAASLTVFNTPVPVTNVAAVTPTFSTQPPFPPNLTINGFDPNLRLPYSHQWNVAIEKSFGSNQALSITYVGQAGRRQLRLETETKTDSQLGPSFSAGDTFLLTRNGDSSDYKSLQVQYRKNLSHRLQALANYTWSRSTDANSADSNGSVFPNSLLPISGERGRSDFDIRHNFSAAVTYDIPGSKGDAVLSKITSGWSLDAVVIARTGFPINVIQFLSISGQSGFRRPDLVAGVPFFIQDPTVPNGRRLNPAAFTTQTVFRQGTLPRNVVPGFGASQLDLSVRRKFSLTERLALQLRMDAFNILNHPNFTNPRGNLVGGNFSPAFDRSTSTLNNGLGGLNALYQMGGPRSLQLSAKILF